MTLERENSMKEYIWKSKKHLWCGLPWTFTDYAFDQERFYLATGILNKSYDEVRLYRVLDISLKVSLSQRIFGLGTIALKTSDKTLGDFEIVNIKNAKGVMEMLSETVEAEREKKHVMSREYMSENDDGDDDDF